MSPDILRLWERVRRGEEHLFPDLLISWRRNGLDHATQLNQLREWPRWGDIWKPLWCKNRIEADMEYVEVHLFVHAPPEESFESEKLPQITTPFEFIDFCKRKRDVVWFLQDPSMVLSLVPENPSDLSRHPGIYSIHSQPKGSEYSRGTGYNLFFEPPPTGPCLSLEELEQWGVFLNRLLMREVHVDRG